MVWIDHVHAVVAHLGASGTRYERIDPNEETPHLHRRSGPPGTGRRPDDVVLFETVASTLHGTPEILVVGPGQAKHAFMRWLESHHADVARQVVAVETVDHPTEAQLVASARATFRRVDQLLGDG